MRYTATTHKMALLLQKLASLKNLRLAWQSINKSNPYSHGIDGVTIQNFETNLNINLKSIRQQLLAGTFEFTALKGRLIEKDGSKPRPLKIPVVRDRVVQRAIRNVIEKRFKKFNYDCSFGYVEKRSRENAVSKIVGLRDEKYWFVLEADIKSFFDCVNQDLLSGKVLSELSDRSIDELIKKALNAEIGNKVEFSNDDLNFFPDGTVGIPQGGILSPFFANVYLSAFDKYMLGFSYKLIRYADDFVVLCMDKPTAEKAYEHAKNYLESELKLSLHPLSDEKGAKTRITNFAEGFNFLGYTFNHHKITPTKKSCERFISSIDEALALRKPDNLIDSLFKLKNMILGWANAYKFCHRQNLRFKNFEVIDIFQRIENHVHKKILKTLIKCELVPNDFKLRGFHLKKLGVPSLVKILN